MTSRMHVNGVHLERDAHAQSGPASTDAESAPPPSSTAAPENAPGMLEHVSEIARHLTRLARLRAARAKLDLRTTIAAIVAGALLLLVTSVLCVNGALLFARGLAGTIAELAGQRVWLGELLGGLALLAGPAALAWLAWTFLDRRELRKQLEEHRRETHTDA